MVEGYWDVLASGFYNETEKNLISEKLANRINADGILLVKSQLFRSQLENKQEVLKKMHALIAGALKIAKKRKPTKPTKSSQQKRITSKVKNGLLKQDRQKINVNV